MEEILKTFRYKLNEMRIDECIDRILEANPYHQKDSGRFPKGGGKKGDVYSLSKPAAEKEGISTKYAYRGKMTGNKDKKGKEKVMTPFGANHGKKACGVKTPTGAKAPKKYKCSSYSDRYLEESDVLLDEEGGELNQEQAEIYWNAKIRNAIKDEIHKALNTKSCSLSQITKALDIFARAKDGDLHKDPSKGK